MATIEDKGKYKVKKDDDWMKIAKALNRDAKDLIQVNKGAKTLSTGQVINVPKGNVPKGGVPPVKNPSAEGGYIGRQAALKAQGDIYAPAYQAVQLKQFGQNVVGGIKTGANFISGVAANIIENRNVDLMSPEQRSQYLAQKFRAGERTSYGTTTSTPKPTPTSYSPNMPRAEQTSYSPNMPRAEQTSYSPNMPRAEQLRGGGLPTQIPSSAGRLVDTARLNAEAAQAIAAGYTPEYIGPQILASLKSKGVDLSGVYGADGWIQGSSSGNYQVGGDYSGNGTYNSKNGTVTYKDTAGFSNYGNIDARGNVIGTGGGVGIRNAKGQLVNVRGYRSEKDKPGSYTPTYQNPLTPEQMYLLQNPGSFGLTSWRINA